MPDEPHDDGERRSALAFFYDYGVAIIVVLAIAVFAIVQVTGGDDEPAPAPAAEATTAEPPVDPTPENLRGTPARTLFAERCGTCHTLTPAGTTAAIGPNLDKVRLSAARVRSQIATGSLDSSMPARLIEGEAADRVARYVARVAGGGR